MSGDCHGTITNQSNGTISSPGYPSNYPNRRFCTWGITVEEGMQIELSFTMMDIEQVLIHQLLITITYYNFNA